MRCSLSQADSRRPESRNRCFSDTAWHRRPAPRSAGRRTGAHPRRSCRRLRAPARGDRAATRGLGIRDRRAKRYRRGSAAEGPLVQTRYRDRRHQDAADADRRRATGSEGDPRQAPGDSRARPLPVRRGGLRARAPAGQARKESATCSRTGSTTWPTSSRRSSGSPAAAPRSIPAWSRNWSAGDEATTHSTS